MNKFKQLTALLLGICMIVGLVGCVKDDPIPVVQEQLQTAAPETTQSPQDIVGVVETNSPAPTEIPTEVPTEAPTPSPEPTKVPDDEEDEDPEEDFSEYTWFTLIMRSEGKDIGSQNRYSDKDSETFKIKTEVPSRAGYKFVCWNTNKNGSGKSYQPGDSIIVKLSDSNGEATRVIYAIWEAIETQEPTATPTSASTQEPTATPTPVPETPVPTTPEPDPTEEPATPTPEPTNHSTSQAIDLNSDFYMSVAQYMLDNGYADKSFIVSPTSFRAALCLAIAGADKETKDQLLHAAGFATQEEANAWYSNLMASVDEFENLLNSSLFGDEAPEGQFSIANAIWNNASIAKDFLDSYKEYVKSHYNADAKTSTADQITNDVNSWCDEKTHGMIDHVADDLSQSASVLANALYLKTSWCKPFYKQATKTETFHCADGSDAETEFMHMVDSFLYYGDDDSQIVVLQLYGNKQLVLVLGNTNNLSNKLKLASYQSVNLSVPKLDITSNFNNRELVEYLRSLGAELPFDRYNANFTKMCQPDEQWYIDDIAQVARIKTDEDGLEAAAVTIISVKAAGIADPVIPIDFIADHPFTFFVTSNLGETNQEILFIGQMAEVK